MTDDPVVPPSIELAWGRRDRPARGPKPGLTLDKIVTEGIKVAMTDGLPSASMARVASELGVATMALYRYVSSKDELLELMVDAALGPAPGAHLPDDGWRAGLTRWTDAARARYRLHPWALRVPIDAPPLGPNNIAWLEDALTCMAETPLSEPHKLSTVMLLSGFVRNESRLSADVAARAAAEGTAADYGRVLGLLIAGSAYPSVRRALDGGAFANEWDDDYEYGRERILDGLESFMRNDA